MTNPRRGLGRRKIEIQKIANKGYLQVAFSRRRAGIFKKASELSTLCGAEIAIVVFSPAGKPFSFGYPHVDTIIDRYLSNNLFPKDAIQQLLDFQRNAAVHELTQQYNELVDQMEVQKNIGEELKQMARASRHNKFHKAIEDLDLQELEQLKGSLEEIQMKLNTCFDEIMIPPSMLQMPMINNNMINPFGVQANEVNALAVSNGYGPFGAQTNDVNALDVSHGYGLNYGCVFY